MLNRQTDNIEALKFKSLLLLCIALRTGGAFKVSVSWFYNFTVKLIGRLILSFTTHRISRILLCGNFNFHFVSYSKIISGFCFKFKVYCILWDNAGGISVTNSLVKHKVFIHCREDKCLANDKQLNLVKIMYFFCFFK